jgi:hypothetical protein
MASRAFHPLAGLLLVLSCSVLSELDELGTNAGLADASTDRCVRGQDCSGCLDCNASCACLSPANLAQCLALCADAGGASGTAGSAGQGGIGGGGVDASTGGAAGAAATAGSAGSAGSGNLAGVVHCEVTNDCSLSNHHCCVNTTGDGKCAPLSTACPGLTVDVRCDGPEDCADPSASICCAIYVFANYFDKTECRSECASPNAVVCGTSPGACPDGASCSPSQFPQYRLCK